MTLFALLCLILTSAFNSIVYSSPVILFIIELAKLLLLAKAANAGLIDFKASCFNSSSLFLEHSTILVLTIKVALVGSFNIV
ncbi:hypothetical protein [Campylobacter sp. RM12651]|uniref:hypothetical protein n=1 Tax=Campylobacter sp. RM12651 TaxID=1660079 RepID=UPI001EFA524F|nr:hypothetical protein [Campylobacter sp. RM12651]